MKLNMHPVYTDVMVDEQGYTYPSRYTPGVHWAVDEAWQLLNNFAPDALPRETRFLLSGMIAGALMRNSETEKSVSLRFALQESLKLQKHYAELLNGYDGGRRITFNSVDAWLERLRALAEAPPSKAKQ